MTRAELDVIAALYPDVSLFIAAAKNAVRSQDRLRSAEHRHFLQNGKKANYDAAVQKHRIAMDALREMVRRMEVKD